MKRVVILLSVLVCMAVNVFAFSFQPKVSPIVVTADVGLFGNNSVDIGAGLGMDFMFSDHLGFGLDTYFTSPLFALGGMIPIDESNKYTYSILEHDDFAFKIFTLPSLIIKESDKIKGPAKVGIGLLFNYQNIEKISVLTLGISGTFGYEHNFTDHIALDYGWFTALHIYEFAWTQRSSHNFFPLILTTGGSAGIKFKF